MREATASDPEGRAEEEPWIISLAMAWGSTLRGLDDDVAVVVAVPSVDLGRGTEED